MSKLEMTKLRMVFGPYHRTADQDYLLYKERRDSMSYKLLLELAKNLKSYFGVMMNHDVMYPAYADEIHTQKTDN